MAHRDNISRVYKDLHEDDKSVVSVETTTGLWSGDTGSISTFYTSTTQLAKEAGAKYFVDVYDKDPATDTSSEIQFSVAYGHVSGAGSPTLTQQNTSVEATKAVYMQMKNLLLESTDVKFTFGTAATRAAASAASFEQIYVISFARSRYKGYVDPGNWQLCLSGSYGYTVLIDDSSQTLGTRRSHAKNGLVFNVVSGSLSGTQGSTIAEETVPIVQTGITAPMVNGIIGEKFGLFYPQKGIIVLNADVIDTHVGFHLRDVAANKVGKSNWDYYDPPTDNTLGENTASAAVFVSASLAPFESQINGGTTAAMNDNAAAPRAAFTASLRGASGVFADQYNYAGFLHSIVRGGSTLSKRGESVIDQSGGPGQTAIDLFGFEARSAEIVSSMHYFLRLNNKEFNYSNNPSFATGSNGQLTMLDFENDPKVYVTAVGLYNDSNELLAVAKLSRPLEKSFSKEALLRVRLDF
jgi:hypothetical protein